MWNVQWISGLTGAAQSWPQGIVGRRREPGVTLPKKSSVLEKTAMELQLRVQLSKRKQELYVSCLSHLGRLFLLVVVLS